MLPESKRGLDQKVDKEMDRREGSEEMRNAVVVLAKSLLLQDNVTGSRSFAARV